MTIAEDVETLARELGVWHWAHIHENRGRVGLEIHERGGGGYFIRDWLATESGVSSKGVHLTAPEAALFLRCVASGLTVELPCSDCEGSKVETMTRAEAQDAIRRGDYKNFGAVWRAGWNYSAEIGEAGGWPLLARPCPTCSEPGPEIECKACDEGVQYWTREGEWSADRADGWGSPGARRSCPACAFIVPGPGVPTGRETVGLAAAWLRGRDWACASCDGPCPSCEEPGKDCARCDGTADLGCAECSDGTRATGVIHGDPSTREALDVLADKRQSEGGALGELLALDLAGAPCPGGCFFVDPSWPPHSKKTRRYKRSRISYPCGTGRVVKICPTCEGHGTALAQRLRQLGTAAHPAASLTAAASA